MKDRHAFMFFNVVAHVCVPCSTQAHSSTWQTVRNVVITCINKTKLGHLRSIFDLRDCAE